jgi:hypothetical protein
MGSKNNARFHHNQETRSEEDFTSSGSEDWPLMDIFHESNEEITDNAEHNNTDSSNKHELF